MLALVIPSVPPLYAASEDAMTFSPDLVFQTLEEKQTNKKYGIYEVVNLFALSYPLSTTTAPLHLEPPAPDIDMLAILEPFCPLSTMAGTVLPPIPRVPRGQVEPLVVNQTEEEMALPHPLTEIVAEPEAKQVILDMLDCGTPESVIRSIFDSGYYEIAVSSKTTSAPYIAIAYTNDDEEGYVYDMNSQPPQQLDCLMVPRPGMTSVERGEWEDETWNGLQWGSIEYIDDSGEVSSIPWPALYTSTDFEDLEAASGLQMYFSECEDRSWGLCTSVMNSGIETWRLSKSSSSRSPRLDMWIQDWSEDYELGDVQQ
ncbi:unnamed protein product [Rhizoctonia solani]|uniref:Uncharacterized protein n=1 Tax=Rhizoctonia solani TaxID=456999 RepID=A0A8H3AZS3_9AGAM|nr:unnamed protein product [Rhizoctonia solani]